MFVINYIPCAINSEGIGSATHYNVDGAIAPATLTAIFDAAKTGGKVDGNDVYFAELVSSDTLAAIVNGKAYVNDTILPNEDLRAAYICASRIDGATVVDGLVVTQGGTAVTYALPVKNTASVISLAQSIPYLAADNPSITANVLTNIAGLGFAIGPNEVWRIEAHIFGNTSSSSQCVFGITGPVGPAFVGLMSDARTGSTGVQHKHFTAFDTEDNTFAWTGGVDSTWHLHGVIGNGITAGTFQLQARNLDGFSQINILAGSHLIATRIS